MYFSLTINIDVCIIYNLMLIEYRKLDTKGEAQNAEFRTENTADWRLVNQGNRRKIRIAYIILRIAILRSTHHSRRTTNKEFEKTKPIAFNRDLCMFFDNKIIEEHKSFGAK
jgi:hypothetical protein